MSIKAFLLTGTPLHSKQTLVKTKGQFHTVGSLATRSSYYIHTIRLTTDSTKQGHLWFNEFLFHWWKEQDNRKTNILQYTLKRNIIASWKLIYTLHFHLFSSNLYSLDHYTIMLFSFEKTLSQPSSILKPNLSCFWKKWMD